MQLFHRARRTWTRDVDRFIVPSAFARAKLIHAGLPADRLWVRSNAIVPAAPARRTARDGLLYAGRLTPNKGIRTLLEAWSAEDMPVLRIAGDGELAPAVQAAAAANPNIEYLGPLSSPDVVKAMRHSIALVVPSIWYEIQGLVILEAFSCATPVIGSSIGAIPEAVRHGDTGLLFPPGDATALAERARWATANPDAMRGMGDQARTLFDREFSPARSLNRLVEIYETARAHVHGVSRQQEPV
jgi:glycosyltransferase involved in cell wall biosynthesis